tara:strand:+ start:445 stop:4395 length:3951 start_codon:yes stop_codon:yes gene_type:complete
MANELSVKLTISDNGTLKLTEKSAKKLEKALQDTGVSAQTADRQLKGAARTSSNTTKNFSKMAQGVSGGLVPAYATLAAQVFAVSAAFQFLSEAANFKNLMAGQQAFGAITGVTYKSISTSLQEATEGQLKYSEAARAAAIGTAAGLTAAQLEEIGVAAKNVSLALGRDLTDSFNRLTRGITKAEPELLDELGIVLRLDPALRRYADAIDKNVSELTAFERTQAVANETLTQAREKFAEMESAIDPSAFAVQQFVKAFDDLINKLKIGLATVAETVLPFFTRNIHALIGALTLFAIPIVKSILPSFTAMRTRLDESVAAQKIRLEELQAEYNETALAAQNMANTQAKALAGATAQAQGAFASAGMDVPQAKRGSREGMAFILGASDAKGAKTNAAKILSGARAALNEEGIVTRGKLKGLNAAQLADLEDSYDKRIKATKDFDKKQFNIFDKGLARGKQGIAGFKSIVGNLFSFVSKGFGFLLNIVSKFFVFTSIVSTGFLLKDLAKEFFNLSDGADSVSQSLTNLEKEAMSAGERAGILRKELQAINEKRTSDGFMTASQRVVQLGNAIAGIDILGFNKDIQDLTNMELRLGKDNEEVKEFRDNLAGTAKEAADLDPIFRRLGEAVQNKTEIDKEDLKTMVERQSELHAQAVAVNQLSKATEVYQRVLDKFIESAPALPFEAILKAQGPVIDALRKNVTGMLREQEAAIAHHNREIATIPKTLAPLRDQLEQIQGQAGADELEFTIRILEQRLKTSQDFLKSEGAALKQMQTQLETEENFRKRLLKNREKYLAFGDDLQNNERQRVMLAGLGESFEARRAKTQIAVLSVQDKVTKAKEAELLAQDRVAALSANTGKEERKRVELAEERATFERQTAELMLANALDIQKNEIFRTNLAEKRNEFAQRELMARIIMANLETDKRRTEAGLDIGRFGTLEERGEAQRTQQIDILGQRGSQEMLTLIEAEERRRDLLVKSQTLGNNIQQEELTAAKAAVIEARNRLNVTSDELEKLINVREITLDQLRLEEGSAIARNDRLSFSTRELEIQQRLHDLQKSMGVPFTDEQRAEARGRIESLIELEERAKNVEKVAKGMENAFVDAFMSILDGSKKASEAFADMAKSIIKMILEMMVRATIMKFIINPLFGFKDGGIASPPKARTGGVFSDGKRSYQPGGISKGPESGYLVELHGTEAVVPLPDGKTIPAELTGKIQAPTPVVNLQTDTNAIASSFNSALNVFKAETTPMAQPMVTPPVASNGNGTNNVTVNVSMEKGESTTEREGGGQNIDQLGRVVAAAVQAELQHQKRPGGILSPFGAA